MEVAPDERRDCLYRGGEEVRPVELPADVLDEQLIGKLVDRARASGLQLTGEGSS